MSSSEILLSASTFNNTDFENNALASNIGSNSATSKLLPGSPTSSHNLIANTNNNESDNKNNSAKIRICNEAVSKLIQPRDHRAKITIWADLTIDDVDHLEDCTTPEQIRRELARIFNIQDSEENLKSLVLLDLYYYTINFARENEFSPEQTSAFFSIVKRTHEIAIETPFGNLQQCFNYFREMVLRHSVKRPPFSIDLFSPEQVRKILDYVLNTYFRHFKLYKYTFTPQVRLDLNIEYPGRPVTPPLETEAEEVSEQQDEAQITEEHETKEIEDSPAVCELKQLIREHLSEELKKLRISVDEQLKQSEDILNQKLAINDGGSAKKSSAKKKK